MASIPGQTPRLVPSASLRARETMKRKADNDLEGLSKKKANSNDNVQDRFRQGLFSQDVLDQYTNEYASSEP